MGTGIFALFLATLCGVGVIGARLGERIVGGADAAASQFPFAAAITIHTSDSRFFCGGALLSQLWVLTSAHCADGAVQFTIQLGSHTLTLDDPDRQILASSEYVLHPEFDSERIENDLALIKLRLPISYNAYIQPINLPVVSLLNDTEVTAIGWGQKSDSDPELSEHLQFVRGAILSNTECQLYYGNQITESMACLEGNFNQGTCIGDNGGPIIEYVSRQYWVVGVASFISANGCESTDPSGYTRTYPYLDWIRSYIMPQN